MFKRAYLGILAGWAQIRDRASTPETAALADIIKVAGLHRTTDTYGPLPYLNIKAGVINTKYDSQEAIYDSFFKELDNAINILTAFSQNFPNSKNISELRSCLSGRRPQMDSVCQFFKTKISHENSVCRSGKAKLYAESAVNHPIGVIKLLMPVPPSNLLLQILSEIQFLIYAFNMMTFVWEPIWNRF